VPPDDTGTFRIGGLTPGAYVVSGVIVEGDPAQPLWNVENIMVGGKETNGTIVVDPRSSLAGLTIGFTNQQSEVRIDVADPAGAPVRDVFVVLFAATPELRVPASSRMPPPVRPGSDGRCLFRGLPPGDYLVAVVASARDDLRDPAILASFVKGATKLRVATNDRQTVRLVLESSRESP